MKPAELPKDEALRIAALMQCGVLDTQPEQDFDDLTALAAELLNVPISLVSLIDTDRQWFKSSVGVDVPESGRDIAFCSHAILGEDLFVVPDATKDARFHDNPFVTEPPHIRFYAGAPLRSADGFAYGTLCVIDDQPRELSEEHASILRGLARQATAQLELRRRNRELEAEMQTRREAEKQLEDARCKADEANLAKSTFLAQMSHEIRNPLGSIIGFSEQLALQEDAAFEQQRDWIDTIRGTADHLLSLVNDVLDVSKIEAREMSFESLPTDVAELVEQTAAMLRPGAEAKGLKVETDLDPDMPEAVLTDPTRLRQVVVNLVGNAIKFTQRGGVTLRLRYERDASPPRIRLAVRDTGPGLDEAALGKLFRAFSQGDDGVARRHGGTGLGLHISREICRQLGGDLRVESEVGKGSTFECELPAEAVDPALLRGPARGDHAASACVGGGSRCRVLVADDCEANRKLFGLMLRRAGYEVAFAENGQEAVDACKQSAGGCGYHLVLMDMQMPEVDGLEATRRLRAMGYRRPIVALTADATIETRNKAEESGCDDFLAKPLRSQHLLDTMARLLGHRRHEAASTAA